MSINKTILDEYTKEVKNDENLSFEEQKLLVKDADRLKSIDDMLNDDIEENTNSLDFSILQGLTENLRGFNAPR